jgi:hypothetical protein
MGDNSKKIVGFKRFSDIKSKTKIEEVDPSINGRPESTVDLPANPNLPENADKKNIEKPMRDKKLQPKKQDINLPTGENEFNKEEEKNEKVNTFGKVAKFPKNVKASKAFNFLESVKISKKSIWYIMVEKDQDLQLVKYNVKEGVDLNKFVNDLKSYYINKYKDNKVLCESISNIEPDGNDKYSIIRKIPNITVDGKKMISVITEDLIKLLSR